MTFSAVLPPWIQPPAALPRSSMHPPRQTLRLVGGPRMQPYRMLHLRRQQTHSASTQLTALSSLSPSFSISLCTSTSAANKADLIAKHSSQTHYIPLLSISS